jgi:hypothetical protein
MMNTKITYLMVAAVAATALTLGLPSMFQPAAAFHTNTATGGDGGDGGDATGGNGGTAIAILGNANARGGDATGGAGGRGGDADASTVCQVVLFC